MYAAKFVHMIIAYVDETGDTGPLTKAGASACYGLGCVMIPQERWAGGLDRMVAFRRGLRDRHKILVRAELKSAYLVGGKGSIKHLGLEPFERRGIFAGHLRQLADFGARAFSVVIDKSRNEGSDVADLAWDTLLQRLERVSAHSKREVKPSFLIVHDEGDDVAVRRRVRKARVRMTAGSLFASGGQTVRVPIVEDAIARDSSQSYFLQLADMVAYAGWRTYIRPGASVAKIVPANSWNALGAATHIAVNSRSLNGSVPGVVLR